MYDAPATAHTTSAISSGRPGRPIGIPSTIRCREAGDRAPVMAVSTKPGTTRLTRTPCGASSMARVCVSPDSPAFADPYATSPG